MIILRIDPIQEMSHEFSCIFGCPKHLKQSSIASVGPKYVDILGDVSKLASPQNSTGLVWSQKSLELWPRPIWYQ